MTDPAARTEDRLAVCALTYLRPAGLDRLLKGLADLDLPSRSRVRVIIVDNDPEASARTQVERAAASTSGEIEYVHAPARGISAARNAAVRAALDWDATAICFIDDDEWPEPDWLSEFVDTWRTTGADIVTGPVFPVFEEEPPAWIIDGGFFDRRRHEHHEWIRYATTSTVLIDRACLTGREAPFDLAFGMSGGEDTHLFAELREAGFRAIWCDTAHVHETIPASRVDGRWILRREYRRGQTLSLSLRRRRSGWPLVRRGGNAVVQVLSGVGRTVVGVARGRAGVMVGVKQIVFGVGMATGLVGRRFEEYEVIHGA